MPDPFKRETGWLKEVEGIKFWPLTLYADNCKLLAFHPSELSSTDLNDYITSKAYSYHSQGWVSTLDFHNSSGSSTYCVLKGTCRPSQRINDILHKLWVYIQKQKWKNSFIPLHMYGRDGSNLQPCCCCFVSSGSHLP